jgi:hypothetical protein
VQQPARAIKINMRVYLDISRGYTGNNWACWEMGMEFECCVCVVCTA